MIDVNQPDYTNTPASERRPSFSYTPRDYTTPTVSIITPYYNTGPVFLETARSLQRMSFAHWEWVIVDDGSTNTQSLAQLERMQAEEPRVRVLHQANSGPGTARNRAAREARGRYLLQLDSDDLVEPTFVEKALWVLETQPQFAVCNSRTVTFGTKNYLWPFGFD
ncbi:MAG TPA: glycosyltransferase family A protein, partial [Ktedonobacteraceae bacterium]|nr:glycosyltransferase family A protein [Ktedonobacteraceae bacterium]